MDVRTITHPATDECYIRVSDLVRYFYEHATEEGDKDRKKVYSQLARVFKKLE